MHTKDFVISEAVQVSLYHGFVLRRETLSGHVIPELLVEVPKAGKDLPFFEKNHGASVFCSEGFG
jgi:hypothetical protein